MVEIEVGRLVGATGARLVAGDAARMCRGVAIDSREVAPDAVFVAFPGERADGNAFAPQAIEAQAGCVVLTREPAPEVLELAEARGCAVLLTEDPTEFMLRLAAAYRDELSCTVVGVTGSIGKTTTKDALAALLATRYRVHATRGNYNNLIGCPLTILSAPRDTEVLVVEMGMNHFHEIERLSACARPAFGVITKVGTSHIGILGSRENIARAKAEIVSGMAEGADGAAPVLVLHAEDDFTPFIEREFAAPAGVRTLHAGEAADADARACDVELGEDGCASFTLAFAGEEPRRVHLSIPGAQAVPNVLFAATVAHELGVDAPTIVDTLAHLAITHGRTQMLRAACGARVIDDSYNASPESMAAALDLLRTVPCRGARIAVLGEMGELGDEAARLHALTGAYAAAIKPSLLVCVGAEYAREMASAARLMGMDEGDIQIVESTEALIERADGLLGPDDLVLVKASRFIGLDRFVKEVSGDAR